MRTFLILSVRIALRLRWLYYHLNPRYTKYNYDGRCFKHYSGTYHYDFKYEPIKRA
jgi:hypothetical protein